MRSIGTRGACHHLRWSFRISRVTCDGVPVRIIRKLRETSNEVQSLGFSPTAFSIILGGSCRGCRSTRSGPLLLLRARGPSWASGGGCAAASRGGGGCDEDDDDDRSAGSVGRSVCRSSGGSLSCTGSSPELRSGPGISVFGSGGAGILASRGWRGALVPPAIRLLEPTADHLHSPGVLV